MKHSVLEIKLPVRWTLFVESWIDSVHVLVVEVIHEVPATEASRTLWAGLVVEIGLRFDLIATRAAATVWIWSGGRR